MYSLCQLDRRLPESRSAGAPVRQAGEEGFMLLAVVVMVALVLIAMSVAAPVVARQLQREKEIESQNRMEQYVRAIQLYQRKFPGQYPASIKILENTNNIRFLRHVYVDPLTGKADYRLIHQGEQKTKIHVFFGQELDGLAANLGSAGGMQSGGVGAVGGSTNVTSTNALNSGFGGASIGGSSGNSGSGDMFGDTSSSSGAPGTNGAGGTSGTSGANGTGGSSGSSGTSSSSNTDSLDADSLGVIVGVGTSKSGTSITQPNAQTTYEQWEFWYDPRIEMLKQGVNVTGGGMTGGSGTPGGGMGSQSATSFGQNAVTGTSDSPGSNGSAGSFGSFGSTTGTSGSSNPNSSTPNPF
jgi:type II secretory pathway pseudopilin PulG